MAIQGYDAALQNAVKSFNSRMRVVCAAASLDLPYVLVAASPAPSTTVFGVSNINLFKVGSFIWVLIGGMPFYRQITGIAGSVITVAALASPPVAGDHVGLAIDWRPEGTRLDPPIYPFVSAQFLRTGEPYLKKLRSRIQMSVFTANRDQAGARRIGGLILSHLGFDTDTILQQCEIVQTDSESGLNIPQYPMDLEYAEGWDKFPEEDPTTYHLGSEFNLYHR